ncbi:MAG: polyphenol oxidase family protein [Candidatus Caldatribacterium sp.]|nr:polyphenol oxidase family protein [Candidatus Caldatribacterium sp.]
MHFEERESTLVLRFANLSGFPHLEHFFVTRRTPYDVRTEEGRKVISHLFGIGPIFVPYQVHGTDFLVFDDEVWYNASCRVADAVLVRRRGFYCGVLVADCVPLLLFAPESEVVALVHAGWRGIARGIHRRVLQAMRERFSVSPSRLVGGVGPAIGPCCFEVGEEVAKIFAAQGKGAWVRWQKEKAFVDLKGIVVADLLSEGVREENLEVSSFCTFCEESLFYSFRRDRTEKRCLLVAGLRG